MLAPTTAGYGLPENRWIWQKRHWAKKKEPEFQSWLWPYLL